MSFGNLGTLGLVCGVFVFLKMPPYTHRYEKKCGRDENSAIPRCLMAAKFSNSSDLTGETTLKHWIAQGQIQDLHQSFIS